MTDSIQFAFHIYKEDFKGECILPLNRLKIEYPEIVAKASEKYRGRERVTKSQVADGINWGDVSFFILHHPTLILNALTKYGHNLETRKFYRIPLQNFSDRSLIWKYTRSFKDTMPSDDCIDLGELDTIDLTSLPQATLDYYREMQLQNLKPLLFAYVPHLLCPDPVSIGNADVITI